MTNQAATIPVTAIITAFDRMEQTKETIRRILCCSPAPDEVIIHVDGNQSECEGLIRAAYPQLRLLCGVQRVGPGGGRNKLIAAATNSFVASFDDDSYPIDGDYFARIAEVFSQFPEAAIATGRVYHRHEPTEPTTRVAHWVADFCGGACVYRRDAFLGTSGYVPLATAYGMEEVDLAIRLHARGEKILFIDSLRVYHDTDLGHHSTADITSASIRNLALLAFLRYPIAELPVGVLQVANRLWWLIRHGRYRGIVTGFCQIPAHLWRHRRLRSAIPRTYLRSYWNLRRHPMAIIPE